MKTISEQIRDELNFDPLYEAEKITGNSHKTSKLTTAIGFLENIKHSNRMGNLMDALDDTKFNETVSEYKRKVVEFGFKTIYHEEFVTERGKEEFYIMFHYDYSILLKWDTFLGNVNSSDFYYNWAPLVENSYQYTSSGGYISNGDGNKSYSWLFNMDFTPHILPQSYRDFEPKFSSYDSDKFNLFCSDNKLWCESVDEYIKENNLNGIWKGSHDGREAIKFNIMELVKNGKFLQNWIEQPFLWLLHHEDTNGEYDYKEITNNRMSQLPEDVQKKIKFI